MAQRGSRSRRSGKPPTGPDSEGDAEPAGNAAAADSVVESEQMHLVVGIGASAGGLEAFKAFFAKMPADSGMSFVLVQHLDPHYESSLAAIVAGYTAMAVHPAEDGTAIRPNHVYVIPPDATLTIKGGILHLARPARFSPAARRSTFSSPRSRKIEARTRSA